MKTAIDQWAAQFLVMWITLPYVSLSFSVLTILARQCKIVQTGPLTLS